MKEHLSIMFVLCVAWTTGCSKKGEECPPFMTIIDTYGKSFAEIQVGADAQKDLEAVQKTLLAIQKAEKKLNDLKLTDEKLNVLKSSNSKLFTQANTMLNEFMQTLSQSSEAKQKTDTAMQSVDDAKAALNAACEKKERWKKSIRVKKDQCDAVNAHLAKLPTDAPDADTINSVVNGLKGLTLSFSAVKTAVDNLVNTLQESAESAATIGTIQKKVNALQAQLEQQKSKNTAAIKELKAYCTN